MKKNVLIASFDLEVGGVERSLISMLRNYDYDQYEVDLKLFSHTGDFMDLLPPGPGLLTECPKYKTFRLSIAETVKRGSFALAAARLRARYKAARSGAEETGYRQMQYMWQYALPHLPEARKPYDIAISYLWPHDFVAYKVTAKTKIAWIHTDYSTVDTDVERDLKTWSAFDAIIAVSDQCRKAFLKKYPILKKKVHVVENITSPDMVRTLASEEEPEPLNRDHRFKFVTVGRLSHAKGIDQAVEALKLLVDKGYSDAAWYVVGYGGDEAAIREAVASYGLEDHFFLLGKKTNPYPYMKAADVYVQPSRYEGKAVTVGEAQILGKPVLITNYPTARSQVKDGVDGLICSQGPKGIADGLEVMLTNERLRQKLSANCLETDYRNHDELLKLYTLP
ncbi:glycosyl transferase [Alteribacter lacisalsi]|uniref:Glycosyl transferase n=1 Tax=Alteribacter lacisalsi TaxID=2045244 RepID=A0A2W0H547_9BACI|nr:glycosyltransferase [Alteribacter lacisalsi]PYZ96954.1 glycosyl transferase [Alteribacter lacisalsi]